MSMRTLERAVLAEAKKVTGNEKLRMKDIQEWTTGEIEVQPDEKEYYLPELRIRIAVKK